MKVKHFITILFVSVALNLAAQKSGNTTYSFLEVATNARNTALAGTAISQKGALNQLTDNAAFIDSSDHNISFNYNNFVGGINGGALFFQPIKKGAKYAISFQYFNYGDILQTDEAGNIIGNFSWNDMALATYFKLPSYKNIRFGASVKVVYSIYDVYQTMGLGVDFGAYKTLKEDKGHIGLVIKNIGTQLISYGETTEFLPLNLQFGYAKKLDKAPFTVSLLANNLQTWNLAYDDGSGITIDPITGEENKEWFSFDKLARHFAGGIEFAPFNSFKLRLGYHHQLRREMSLATRNGFAGFSMGLGLAFNRFLFEYGVSGYHLSGSAHVISLNTKI